MANFAQLVQGTLPPDTGESPTLGAQRIRETKIYLAERFSWVYGLPVDDSEADATKLGVKTIPFNFEASDPSTPASGKLTLYSKKITPSGGSEVTELFMIDSDANVIQITTQGALNVASVDLTPYLNKDGSVALTANWDAGSYKITAETLESDVATGTAPLIVASTTKVSNLNADLLDGYSFDETEIKPLGSWASRTVGTIYQASTDGFAVGHINETSNANASLKGFTDSSSSPTTLRMADNGNAGTPGVEGSICMPVKKNDYYKFTQLNTSTGVMYWIPLGV